MQTLDIHRPDMPDLQFTLLVTALCTSRLTALNIPGHLRTTIFDRCWVLIHDSPPPRNPEERVLDLRPWNDVTLDAMVETIRSVLTEAGIRTLTWDHPPSDPTRISTPAVQPLIDRLEQLYPQPAQARETASGEALVEIQDRRDDHKSDVRQLISEIAVLMAALAPALEGRAEDLAASGKDCELIRKLLKGADVMRDSGYMYLAWARHYAGLPEDNLNAADDGDESKQQPNAS
jgi:cytochrome c556